MEITAALVKELRERSGAGMMECKKALSAHAGDIDAAMEHLRKTGLAKADKKANRVAAEGRIVVATAANDAVLVEINSETDFVAKDENFIGFTDAVAAVALSSGVSDIDGLKASKLADGSTVDEARAALIAKVGENVQVRRLARIVAGQNVGAYVHGNRIGVLVNLKGGSVDLARGIAMHVAAMNPKYLSPADAPADFVAKEKEIALAQMSDKDKAKPAEIQEKMISGKLNKILSEISLTGQAYVLDNDLSVEQALAKEGAQVLSFERLVVGEGIEKKEDDFAAEVMKQAGLA
ncbi:MAG TPA: translation elongation factor Ts [Chiayiivirga sp.]|nr:translation elongation factor Ts [Chiayiivirga sp.]